MNEYEQKLENRKERLQARADKKREQAQERRDYSDGLVSSIPFGQPILVGHHSEGAHRNRLKRSQNAMFKSVELEQEARDLDRRTENVGKGGISSDDPEAIAKLKKKLSGMEESQELMKKVNRQYKKGGLDAVDCLSDTMKQELKADMERDWLISPKLFESYALQNNNVNMRRVKQRIEELERQQQEPEREDITGDGWTVKEDKEDNRIHFIFDDKPDAGTRKLLKSNGFKWSPTRTAWVRQINNTARYAAQYVAKQLNK